MSELDRRLDSAASALECHPHVSRVSLGGSRARGDANELSDWDFEVEVDDFRSVAADLQELVAPLEPLAQQWDRLSDHQCYMLTLRGPAKVDFLFAESHEHEPPWRAGPETLAAIDRHFWDWTLWLASKERAGRNELVAKELEKMHGHLLAPLGVKSIPTTLRRALESYLAAREQLEDLFHVEIPRDLEDEIKPVILGPP